MAYLDFPFTPDPQESPCDISTCTPVTGEDCSFCGYDIQTFENCNTQPTPCLDGSAECLNCSDVFGDIEFLGGFIASVSSKLGFGTSESTLNVELIVQKTKCTFVDDLTEEECTGNSCVTPPPETKYQGELGHIYTLNLGNFCFRGILNTHTYSEDSGGYKYRVSLTDGRSVLSHSYVLLNGIYYNIPEKLRFNTFSIVEELESSITNNTCGDGKKCYQFMDAGVNSIEGIKLKTILEAINNKCVGIPLSNAGLRLNLNKLIAVVNDEIKTTDSEMSILDIINTAAENSGYDFIISINNDNEFEVQPINYKYPATEKSLFGFIKDLVATDTVISSEYGEEMVDASEKNKKVVFGDFISYITSIRDFAYQAYEDPEIEYANKKTLFFDGIDYICCLPNDPDNCNNTDPNYDTKEKCEAAGGTWFHQGFCDASELACPIQPPCTVKNSPASIKPYQDILLTPTPIPNACQN